MIYDLESDENFLSGVIGKGFYDVYKDFIDGGHTHYFLCGGRGSGKSTFAAICVVLGIMRKEIAENAIVFRKFENKLKDSVFEQMMWVIDKLGVGRLWKKREHELEFLQTGGKILFKGVSNAHSIKSVKAGAGFGIVWFEEADEFSGMNELRSVLQSVVRGKMSPVVLYTFNPPKEAAHWINAEALETREDRLVHRSTYLDIPEEWLGSAFVDEAEYLKKQNELVYKNEYLGEVGCTGGEVFRNLNVRSVEESEIERFCNVKRGIDFGFAADPFAYVCAEYEKKAGRLIVFHEDYAFRLPNWRAAELIKEESSGVGLVVADSSEPKSIDELKSYGIRVTGAKKGKDSIYYGVKFLQDLREIVIDPLRCPNCVREFRGYCYESDGRGNYLAVFRDRDNHCIDALRYAVESETRLNGRIRDKGRFRGII